MFLRFLADKLEFGEKEGDVVVSDHREVLVVVFWREITGCGRIGRMG